MRAGIYTYPWDLADEGHDLALGRIAAAGFTAVNLACAYHAGKFLLPHNPRRRVAFAEDGALYFRPDPTRYGRIRPRVSALVTQEADPLADLDRERRRHGLDLVAWVVCLHNSWLGERYPDCTLHNAFGDPYWHSLCPAHPDVRAYLAALLADLVTRADIAAVELESPDYLGFTHDFHHEIVGVPLDETQQRLLSLSFNPVEIDRARADGIDGEGLRRQVADALSTLWATAPPAGAGAGMLPQVRRLLEGADFHAYLALRERIVADLLADLRDVVQAASPQTEVRLFAPAGPRDDSGLTDDALPDLADGVLAWYASSDADASRRARDLRAIMGAKPVYGLVRALAPDTVDLAQIAPRVAAWRESGVAGINFYNYGLMTLPMLGAIGAALRQE